MGRDTNWHSIFNIVKKCFGELYDPLKFIFDFSLEKRIFPDDLKIARFNPVFIGGDRSTLGNYRPISVLPFLKYLIVLCIIAFTNNSSKTNVLTPEICFSSSPFNWPRNYSTWQSNIWSFSKQSVYAGGVYLNFKKAFK